jgi:hypothetical protein
MVWSSTARTFLSRTHVTAAVHLTRPQLSMGAEPAADHSRSRFDWPTSNDRNGASTFRPSHDKSFGEHMVHQPVARLDNATIA